MNEPGRPPLDAPSIGAEQARRCIDAYIDAWNEPEADERGQILAQVMTDDGAYADPAKQMDSPAGLAECIGEVLDKYPGRRIVRTSEVDAHNLVCRFNWRLVKADGTQGPESVDFVDFAGDGKDPPRDGLLRPPDTKQRSLLLTETCRLLEADPVPGYPLVNAVLPAAIETETPSKSDSFADMTTPEQPGGTSRDGP